MKTRVPHHSLLREKNLNSRKPPREVALETAFSPSQDPLPHDQPEEELQNATIQTQPPGMNEDRSSKHQSSAQVKHKFKTLLHVICRDLRSVSNANNASSKVLAASPQTLRSDRQHVPTEEELENATIQTQPRKEGITQQQESKLRSS